MAQGIVKVGAVDADQHNSLGAQYGVRGFPTIKVFGANKQKPEEFQGFRTTFSLHFFLIGTQKNVLLNRD